MNALTTNCIQSFVPKLYETFVCLIYLIRRGYIIPYKLDATNRKIGAVVLGHNLHAPQSAVR